MTMTDAEVLARLGNSPRRETSYSDAEVKAVISSAQDSAASELAKLRDTVSAVDTSQATGRAHLLRLIGDLKYDMEDRIAATEQSLTLAHALLTDLTAQLAPPVSPPIAQPFIQWDNLWKAFMGVPGTRLHRFLLTVWELGLWTICWAGGRWWGWWGLLAFPVAFFIHELFFKLWVTRVVRIPDADDGDIVGKDRKALVTLERWLGDVL